MEFVNFLSISIFIMLNTFGAFLFIFIFYFFVLGEKKKEGISLYGEKYK